ncbi:MULTISPECIES: hypothetical protein [unclassified Streptomyces]|uniref:hypothetical protein n=1 Tax=unclassified Streptomyces TaxID=2593676 RepID=UPI00226DC929|nr:MULTISPECIES: hypothetical protein [unclassified Streptomyces]MCY0920004.1 hypothetical protein [Streptomyces sp. H27-G5]MCY0959548.1 hypothetical protein [Streptomyces sp. H27-H5]
MKLSPNTTPAEPDNLLIRMHNQIGAAIDVTGTEGGARWSCHGCGDVHSEYALYMTREDANAHAAMCRAAYHRLR